LWADIPSILRADFVRVVQRTNEDKRQLIISALEIIIIIIIVVII
jgi:hypothetical protein